ncbi:two-component system nitrogen regulation sensor histidine kinase GlnL [Hasllibacter halocynthiae]|uniref:histidine kinase n=1 Tax=Hasllibacter halocynthiae TaxID=595589 RepID=A0A2T0X899_9RHOB|nr:ATP-binding protein [Hasllibacter halocynthiae]PRY95171.1 two-component system nitrogen regulation sensor histidine kinase GlnL [Hasllibacter halocynthiae]
MSAPWRDDGALWDALPAPAFLVTLDGTIRHANPAAEAFLTLSARALAGTPLARLVGEGDVVAAIARASHGQAEVVLSEVSVSVPRRGPARCDVRVASLGAGALLLLTPRDASGHVPGQVGHGAGQEGAAKGAIGMAQMLAHEIKNPLAGISGAAQLLSMNLSGGDREMTDLIVAETRRVSTLLERVEAFGATPPPRPVAVNLHDLLDRARRSAALGHAAHMRFREDYDPSLPRTSADPDQMVQVLLNLMKNAAEAQPPAAARPQGTITLRTFYEGGLRRRGPDGVPRPVPLQIEVIDDGPGLPPHIAEHVFEPFVSGRENGTGLGLALAARIVGDHGGLVAARSGPGRTAFRLSLPIAEEE